MVVGQSKKTSGGDCAFIWSRGTMTDLNTLIPKHAGVILYSANGINDSGQIACSGAINGQTHGFLLTPK
jgi:probable HAF family extracellular repeat protein